MIKKLKIFANKNIIKVFNKIINKVFYLKEYLIYVFINKLIFVNIIKIKKLRNAFRLYYYYIIKGIKGEMNIKSSFYYIFYINVNLDNLKLKISLRIILKKFDRMFIK